MCVNCGSHLPVKLAKGGNSPGYHYIHCTTCNYHFTFPKLASPHPLPEPFPTATHDGLAVSQVIDCAKSGCQRRGCTQCPCRMCKQCCVLVPSCSLCRRFDQLSSKQQGKLAVSTVPAPLNVMTTPDPLVIFPEQEKQRTEAERVQSLQSRQLEDDEDGHYQAAIAASLAVPHITPHVISSASSSRAPPPSSLPLAHPSVFSMTPVVPLLQPSTKPTTAVRTIPYRVPAPKSGIKEHTRKDWMRPVDGKAPKRRAIHECPLWPKWILWDAVNVCEELDIQGLLLEYFDTRSLQWITCAPSYPHTVKKDEQRKIAPPPYLIKYVSDNDDEHDEVVFVEQQEPPWLKRQLEDDADANPQPLQRQHSNLETGMYAIDMSLGFHQVNQSKTLLDESLLTVFGKKIPPNTYCDQQRYWMALTQEQ
ncbi:hypothetical protein K443DRAFT_131715 [Laccaria amethystina LaAM-08-1]|uniref:Uncharacterized protein n=1 Tax=Laccaria amethystina LaAM-08-1 TaxID=1095629 RepID=A0A0C9WUG7_9AGAR|nr:hypothetical protein K443DRAFT_131715 [Laccaria amethystina LaAM-08-1]